MFSTCITSGWNKICVKLFKWLFKYLLLKFYSYLRKGLETFFEFVCVHTRARVCLCVCVCVCVCAHARASVCMCLCLCLPMCITLYLLVNLQACLPECLFVLRPSL